MQPDNQSALSGIREVADLLVDEARGALKAGDAELATSLLDAASAAAPGRDSVKRLRRELSARERNAQRMREEQRQRENEQAAERQQRDDRERLENAINSMQ